MRDESPRLQVVKVATDGQGRNPKALGEVRDVHPPALLEEADYVLATLHYEGLASPHAVPPSVARSARLRAAQVDSNDHFMNHVVVFGGFFSLDLCLD